MRRILVISLFFLLLLTGIIYKNWWNFTGIANGDFLGYTMQQIQHTSIIPLAWDFSSGNGFGQFASPFSWLFFIMVGPLFIFGKMFSLPWPVIERISYFFPLLLLLLVMPLVLYRKLFPRSNFYIFSSIIFAFNTYILMLVGGGQIYIALAYSLAPIIFGYYVVVASKEKNQFFSLLVLSLLLSLEVMLDLRITYVVLVGVFLYFVLYQLFTTNTPTKRTTSFFYLFIVPGIFTGLAQAFWVLPTLLMHQNPANQLSAVYTSIPAVQYFSFAKFENTLGLLHPNWPENIFGKVGFMKPEFLVLPILAFSALFFAKRENKEQETESKFVLFFALLGLIGAFLAKGAQDPFGGIYLWMFDHVPGFVMFRDPTKWYLLVAISYSVLIPFSIEKIYEIIKLKTKNLKPTKILNLQNLFVVIVVGYLLFLIRPALVGQLGGTFKPHQVPQEYTELANFLSSQNTWSRTFWIPGVQRYGFNNPIHPAVGAEDFYHVSSISAVLSELRKQGAENKLENAGVKYVLVPYDSEGEIFLKDRKYDNALYLQTVSGVRKISWLHQIPGFGKIVIFAIPHPKDHFWITESNARITCTVINPTEYKISVINAAKGDRVVFVESYDSHWQAVLNVDHRTYNLKSEPYDGFNSFILSKSGNYSLRVIYTPQEWTNIGFWISGISFVGMLSLLAWLLWKRKFLILKAR